MQASIIAAAMVRVRIVVSRRIDGRVGRMGLGYAFASASRFQKAASPASDTSTHFRSGQALLS
jgi:hypothetical protein